MAKLEQVLGQVLADRRRKAGLTQEELAFDCGLHPTYVSQLERGLKSPTAKVLFALAAAMGEKPSVLLRRVERDFEAEPPANPPKAPTRRNR